jgi:hypothetical protein
VSELDGYWERAQNKPLWWAKQFLKANLWDTQKQILLSVRDNRRTAVTACHAIGKTYITACIATWFLMAHPDSIVLLSAPTYRQVKEVLWREIASLYERAKESGCPLGGNFFTDPKWELGKKWFMLGFSPQHPEKAQGFHAPYILIILDEASGINDAVFGALRGIMASGHVRLLMLSNPTRPSGELHRAFTSSRANYKTFQVSAWETPNLQHLRESCGVNDDLTLDPKVTRQQRIAILRAAKPLWPTLVGPEYVADMEEEFGWDSDIYRVRVLGQFPKGAPDQLIPLHHVMEAIYRWEDIEDRDRWWVDRHRFGGHPLSALDPARFGDNESVWCGRLDTVACPLEAWNGLDSVDLANEVAAKIRQRQTLTNRVDADGYGGGPYDNLQRLVPGVIEFRGGTTLGVNTERFLNLRSQDYWGLRDRYSEGRIAHQRCDKLIGQLTSIRYRHRPSGQIQIESKDEMRARGVASPDRADCLMMLYGCQPVEWKESSRETTRWQALDTRSWI